jgi:anti-anti-sigma factor
MDTGTGIHRIDIKGELSIFTAADLRLRLLSALDVGSELEVDLSAVSEMDSAGMQLLVATKKDAAARNKPLRFTGHSPAVVDLLELCDLTGYFGDPLLIRSKAD